MTFTIRLEPSGRSFQVTEDDVILDAALAAGIRMPHGCRAGTCKSCKAKVIEGTAEVGRAFPAPAFLRRLRQFDGYTLMCRATAASDLVIEVDEQPKLAVPRIVPAKVAGLRMISSDVAILRLRLDLADIISFEAGQYVDLLLADGVRRSYSIANAPAATGSDELEFHIRHIPGGRFTDRLFGGGLAAGDALRLEAPLGSFFLRDSDKPVVLLASGTGYAPIRSILLAAGPGKTGRRMVLYWGARTLADLYMLDEARGLAREHPDLTIIPVLSDEPAGTGWDGRTGFVHRAVMTDLPELSAWQVYACGTPSMVEAARTDFVAQCGLPAGQFFADAFLTEADAARLMTAVE